MQENPRGKHSVKGYDGLSYRGHNSCCEARGGSFRFQTPEKT